MIGAAHQAGRLRCHHRRGHVRQAGLPAHQRRSASRSRTPTFVWGMGTRATTETLSNTIEGNRRHAWPPSALPARTCCPTPVIMNSRNHSAGAGLGTVHGLQEAARPSSSRATAAVNVARTRKRPGRPVRLHAARDRRLQQQPRRAVHPAGMGRVLRQGHPLDRSARACTGPTGRGRARSRPASRSPARSTPSATAA